MHLSYIATTFHDESYSTSSSSQSTRSSRMLHLLRNKACVVKYIIIIIDFTFPLRQLEKFSLIISIRAVATSINVTGHRWTRHVQKITRTQLIESLCFLCLSDQKINKYCCDEVDRTRNSIIVMIMSRDIWFVIVWRAVRVESATKD